MITGFTFLTLGVRIVWGFEERTVAFDNVETFRPKRILIIVGPEKRTLVDDRNPKPYPPTYAKMWIKGTKYRRETKQEDKQRRYIENSEGNFQLDCIIKIGVKVPPSSKPEETVSGIDPTRMFALYKRQWENFTKEGSETIDGQRCDRYRGISYKQANDRKIKIIHHLWARQSDQVVLKLESEDEFVHSILEYKGSFTILGKTVSVLLPPSRIRRLQRQPSLLQQAESPRSLLQQTFVSVG
jgi:hypothetical protein